MKKAFGFICVFFISLGLFGFTDAEYRDGYQYEIHGSDCVILSYDGNEREITIPLSFNNLYVTEIGDRAFEGNENLVSISMPGTIQKVGARAFADCINLEYLNISSGLIELGNESFLNCGKLTAVTLPANLQVIGRRAFGGCKAISYFNDLTGANPMKVGSGAFDDTEWFKTKASDLITLSQGYVLLKYLGNDYDPDFSWYLRSIAEDAFFGNGSITSLHLPNYITSLDEGSISGMKSLKAVYGGESLVSVSEGAFRNLPKLQTVEIPNVELSRDNFVDCPKSPYGTRYSEVYDPTLPDEADDFFLSEYNQELDGIIILHCLRNVEFKDGEVIVPDFIRNRPVVIIGEGACQNRDDISNVILPKYLIGIESWAFSYDENLDNVVFPDSLQWIKADAFNGSGITNYVPSLKGVEVDERAFYSSAN